MDLESLCIKIGALCWELTVDLVVVNYDGNLCDCMCFASLAALSLFRLPNYSKSEINLSHEVVKPVTNSSDLYSIFIFTSFSLNNLGSRFDDQIWKHNINQPI